MAGAISPLAVNLANASVGRASPATAGNPWPRIQNLHLRYETCWDISIFNLYVMYPCIQTYPNMTIQYIILYSDGQALRTCGNFQKRLVTEMDWHVEPLQVLSACPAMFGGVLSVKSPNHLPHNPASGSHIISMCIYLPCIRGSKCKPPHLSVAVNCSTNIVHIWENNIYQHISFTWSHIISMRICNMYPRF